jgi:hypothetical protein
MGAAPTTVMATLTQNSLANDHAGARWMVPFATAMAAMVLFIFAMLAYSYL